MCGAIAKSLEFLADRARSTLDLAGLLGQKHGVDVGQHSSCIGKFSQEIHCFLARMQRSFTKFGSGRRARGKALLTVPVGSLLLSKSLFVHASYKASDILCSAYVFLGHTFVSAVNIAERYTCLPALQAHSTQL